MVEKPTGRKNIEGKKKREQNMYKILSILRIFSILRVNISVLYQHWVKQVHVELQSWQQICLEVHEITDTGHYANGFNEEKPEPGHAWGLRCHHMKKGRKKMNEVIMKRSWM